MSIHLERLLRQHNSVPQMSPARTLEINPSHSLIKHMAERAAADATAPDLADLAHLLFDQARIVEGEAPTDPVAFAGRLAKVMEKGLG
jgi:molecular chaperone HtpG